mgnify:CR=1 FL=1
MNVTAINLPQTVSIALLVIAGQFGNGEERKTKLTNAGYDAQTVQNCVNDLFPIINKYCG